MAYEIDFIGVGDRTQQDADAICFRWKTGQDSKGNQTYKIGVYDCGLLMHSEKMTDILNRYYFNDPNGEKSPKEKTIDMICISHPDPNHTVGIMQLLEKFTVKAIYMNRPWLYSRELRQYVDAKRINLEKRLRRIYGCIADIEDWAKAKGVPIFEAFEGTVIANTFRILSPSKDFYYQLLLESGKTPMATPESELKKKINIVEQISTLRVYTGLILSESWTHEELREDAFGTPEDESSVVLLGNIDGENILLTGDAGAQALGKAMDYADRIGVDLKSKVSFFQIPNHGDENSINSSVLNRLLGDILSEKNLPGRTAFASAAKGSVYPHKKVTNAFLRRGVTPYANHDGESIHISVDMPVRDEPVLRYISFSERVEG